MIKVYRLYNKISYYYNINSLYLYKALNNIIHLKYHKMEDLNINKNINK